jgi:hypothetical protein
LAIVVKSERIDNCIGSLLQHGKHVFQASSQEEMINMLEAVSLYLEEKGLVFHFSIDGDTVTLHIPAT